MYRKRTGRTRADSRCKLFSCLATLPASAFVIACPATNPWSLSPTRGDTPVKSAHAWFQNDATSSPLPI
ncbi:hypothetical protein Hanom_Chr04g00311381 [Helianthus anomalus]